jgi:hypothetical protein
MAKTVSNRLDKQAGGNREPAGRHDQTARCPLEVNVCEKLLDDRLADFV